MPCACSQRSYEISLDDFNETMQNIEIGLYLSVTEEDLHIFHKKRYSMSQYKKYDLWKRILRVNFHLTKMKRSPLRFIANKKANSGFYDGKKKHNKYIGRFSQLFISLERTVI